MKTFKISLLIFLFFTSTAFGVVDKQIIIHPFSQHPGPCNLEVADTTMIVNTTLCEFIRISAIHNKSLYYDSDSGFGLSRPIHRKGNAARPTEYRSYFDNVIMRMNDGCYASVYDEWGLMWMSSYLMCLSIQRLILSNINRYMSVTSRIGESGYADTILEIRTSYQESLHDVSVLDFNMETDIYVSVAKIANFGTASTLKSYIVMDDKFHPFTRNLKLYIENPDMFLEAVDYYLANTAISYTIRRNLDHTYNVINMVSLKDAIRDERCERIKPDADIHYTVVRNSDQTYSVKKMVSFEDVFDNERCKKVKRSKRDLEHHTISLNDLMNLYTYSLHTQNIIGPATLTDPIHHLIYMTVPMVDNTVTHIPLYMAATIHPNRHVQQTGSWPARVERNIRNMGLQTDDERGHILGRMLGGSQEVLNVVPMVNSINHHMGGHLSTWRCNEEIMEGFLDSGYGYVEYFVFIQYENLMPSNDPNYRFSPHELRPTHFSQFFTTVFNNGSHTDYGPMTLINDNTFECHDVYSSFD